MPGLYRRMTWDDDLEGR